MPFGGGGSMPRSWIREHWNSVVRLTSFTDPCKLLVVWSFPKLIITSWWSSGFDAVPDLSLGDFHVVISVIFTASFHEIKLQFHLKQRISCYFSITEAHMKDVLRPLYYCILLPIFRSIYRSSTIWKIQFFNFFVRVWQDGKHHRHLLNIS